MGIEAIGSIGTALGSVASGIGRGVPGVGNAATAVSRGSVIGIKPASFLPGFRSLVEPTTPPNNGGVFRPLENFRPFSVVRQAEKVAFRAWVETEPVKPILEPTLAPSIGGGFKPEFNFMLRPLKPGSQVMEAAKKVAVQSAVKPAVRSQFEPLIKPAMVPFPRLKPWVVISPSVESAVETKTGIQALSKPKTETRLVSKAAQAVAIKPVPKEQEVEEIVEEKVVQERAEEGLDEEQTKEKRWYLTDEKALSQRKSEIRQAVIKAKTEADRLGLKKIAGWLVAKFLPAEHEGNRSEVVKKTGPDGSYQETVEAVVGAGEFASEERAMATFYQVAEEKKPVRFGKEGKPVENQDVARVYKYRIVKPVQPFVEVITRVTKKRISKTGQSLIPVVESGAKQEISLKELDPALAEALKAA